MGAVGPEPPSPGAGVWKETAVFKKCKSGRRPQPCDSSHNITAVLPVRRKLTDH